MLFIGEWCRLRVLHGFAQSDWMSHGRRVCTGFRVLVLALDTHRIPFLSAPRHLQIPLVRNPGLVGITAGEKGEAWTVFCPLQNDSCRYVCTGFEPALLLPQSRRKGILVLSISVGNTFCLDQPRSARDKCQQHLQELGRIHPAYQPARWERSLGLRLHGRRHV